MSTDSTADLSATGERPAVSSPGREAVNEV